MASTINGLTLDLGWTPDLRGIPAGLHDLALEALALVRRNAGLLRGRGIDEEALLLAYTAGRTNHHAWPLSVLRRLFAQADRQWRREQAALRSLEIGDVLAAVDRLIASELDPQKHPLFSLAAHALDRTTMPGSAEGLWVRYGKLVEHAVERLVGQKLAYPTGWED